MTSLAMTDPEWVMFGAATRSGVRLIASNSLTRAELEAEYATVHRFDGESWHVTGDTYTLTTIMDQYVVVDASDWPSAFARLFRAWSPDDGRPVPVAEFPTGHGASIAMVRPVVSTDVPEGFTPAGFLEDLQ